MTQDTHVTLLRRKTRVQDNDVVANPLTSSRAVRLALVKAANDTIGLELSVSSVADDVNLLDTMLEELPDDLMLIGLLHDGVLVGFIGVDMQLRAAVLEIQTMGRIGRQPAEIRKVTGADRTLCDPMIACFIANLPQASLGTSIEGWVVDATIGDIIADKRAAGLLLVDQSYRVVQMNVDLSGTDRRGMLLIVLPPVTKPVATSSPAETPADWQDAFQTVINEAPSTLSAILHRFEVSLSTARGFKVGTVLPLPGCTVSSIRLVAADGYFVGAAKLGQSNGMRAVKLQPKPTMDLHDLAAMSPEQPVEQILPDDTLLTVASDMDGKTEPGSSADLTLP